MKGNSFFRRLLALTLSVVLVLSLGATALADDAGEGDALDESQEILVESPETSGGDEVTCKIEEKEDANGSGNTGNEIAAVNTNTDSAVTDDADAAQAEEGVSSGTTTEENGTEDTADTACRHSYVPDWEHLTEEEDEKFYVSLTCSSCGDTQTAPVTIKYKTDENGNMLSATMTAEFADETYKETVEFAERSTYENEPNVAQIGNTPYTSLAEAVENAAAGNTITLLDDTSGCGIIIDSSKLNGLTIDFNGHTYTVNADPLAGSSTTKSQCFQILTGGSVTLKNGAIVADHAGASMIIQNYSNLTLDNMKLDATQGNNSVGYVLSNNCGNVTITSSTITAKSTGVAFDVYGGFGNYGDVSVTVTNDSVINGTVEVARKATDNNNQNTLVIEDSTVNGNVNVTSGTSVTIENNATVSSVTVAENSGASVLVMDSEVTGEVKGNATVYNSTVGGEITNQVAEGVVALVGDTTYTSVQAAINAVAATDKQGEVILLASTAENITIPSGADIILNLQKDVTLTNDPTNTKDHTITNEGTLIIKGDGTVDNVTPGKAALYNSGTCTIESGTLTRSEEAGSDPQTSGGNSWYVICNSVTGDLTINGGSVTSTGNFSSLIDNNNKLTITGGTFTNGMIVIKNEETGTLNISGGSFESTYYSDTSKAVAAVQTWGNATISGGSFKSNGVGVYASEWDRDSTLTITGGTFSGGLAGIYVVSDDSTGNGYDGNSVTVSIENATVSGNTYAVYVCDAETTEDTKQQLSVSIKSGSFSGDLYAKAKNTEDDDTEISVSGGTFSTEVPDEYCAEGYAPKKNSDGTYGVHVHTAVKTVAKAATCTEPGNIDYWYCTECGKYFSDAELTNEITKDETVVVATGHQHVTKKEAKAATETEEGNIAYWYCSDCGKYYSDEAMTKEITQEETVLSKLTANWNGLTLDVTANKDSVRAGRNIIYTLTVTNNTGVTLTDIQVSNAVDKNLTFSNSSSSSYDPDTGVWTISELANGKTATLTLKYKVKSGVDSGTKLIFTSTLKSAESVNSTLTKALTDSVTVKVSNKTSILPDTGDTSRIGMWVGVLVAAAVALGAILVLFTVKKKKAR